MSAIPVLERNSTPAKLSSTVVEPCADAAAYDYFGAFNFRQQPLPPIDLATHPLPRRERAWLRANPPKPEGT